MYSVAVYTLKLQSEGVDSEVADRVIRSGLSGTVMTEQKQCRGGSRPGGSEGKGFQAEGAASARNRCRANLLCSKNSKEASVPGPQRF